MLLLILNLNKFSRMITISKFNLSVFECQFWNNKFDSKLYISKHTPLNKY